MDLRLKDKVVIVTGGANGIGKAIVKGFLEEEAITYFLDRDKQTGNDLLKQLKDARCFFYCLDLREEDRVRETIKIIAASQDKIDVLVNNAGGNIRFDIDKGPSDFRQGLEQNLVSHYTMIHYCWPHLVGSKGNIINIGSQVAFFGEGATSAYAAAKAGILGLTRELNTKSCLNQLGVRVNAVIPAQVNTERYQVNLKKQQDPDGYEYLKAYREPLRDRRSEPKEIADVVVFLASERASRITGGFICVDGGYLVTNPSVGRKIQKRTTS